MAIGTTAAIVGAAAIGAGAYSANKQRSAAKDASKAQVKYSEQAIEEQRRQFDSIVELMKPYVDEGSFSLDKLREYADPGQEAFGEQLALTGQLGPEAERAAIDNIRNGERFKTYQELGEESILNRAGVTGGLRGGRTQGALAEFSPALLQDLIDERYSKLGGITSLGYSTEDALARMGQASAAQQGAFGQQSANAVSGLFGDIGASKAGYALARGNSQAQMINEIMSGVGTGLGLYSGFGGTMGGNTFNPNTAFGGF